MAAADGDARPASAPARPAGTVAMLWWLLVGLIVAASLVVLVSSVFPAAVPLWAAALWLALRTDARYGGRASGWAALLGLAAGAFFLAATWPSPWRLIGVLLIIGAVVGLVVDTVRARSGSRDDAG